MTSMMISRQTIETLPNFRAKNKKEFSAACPVCGGRDRFLFWPDKGNYYCRKCGLQGFADDGTIPTPQQIAEAKQRERERVAAEARERMTVYERLRADGEQLVKIYHSQVSETDYWYSQGLYPDTIDRYQLGYSHLCPTYPKSPSYVIPTYAAGRLVAIRHRLAYPNGSGKYRPEFAGLPAFIFNVDSLRPEAWVDSRLPDGEALLVEGEVKAMYLDQLGYPVAGLPGVTVWNDKWLKFFKYIRKLYIAFDPGAEGPAVHRAAWFEAQGIEVRVVSLPHKPDDFFVIHKGTIADFADFLGLAI